jgi:hypothetical protein
MRRSEKLKRDLKIIFGYMQQTAREGNVTMTCQIGKINAKIFKYNGRNME